jgi:hypothetical protein
MEVAAIRWLSAEMAVMRSGIAASGYGDGSCEQTVSGGGSSGIAVCHLQADADGSCGPMGDADGRWRWQLWADGDGRDADGRWRWQLWADGDGDGSCGPMEMAVLGWLSAEMEMAAVGRWEMQMADGRCRWQMGIASVSSSGTVTPYRKGINNPSFGLWPGPIEPQ